MHPRFVTLAILAAAAAAAGCKKSPQAARGPAATPLPSRPAPPPAAPSAGAPGDVGAPPPDAERSASGLAWKVLVPGSGHGRPTAADLVHVRYTGWTTDGRMFDSTSGRPQPPEVPLGHTMQGWTEGLQLMSPGEKRRFWIPAALAYNPRPGQPPGTLVFDIELLDVVKDGGTRDKKVVALP